MKRVALLLAAASLAAGCTGPDRTLDVDFKEVPSNVVLGAQTSPPPDAPLGPPTAPPIGALPPPPSVITLPPPPFDVPPPGRSSRPPAPAPTGPACPAVDPLRAPAVEAPASISRPPAEGQYLFRNVGTFETSGADAQRGAFPALSLRTVNRALESPEGFVFDVTESLAGFSTTTSYSVVTTTPLGSPDGPGLYLARVRTRDSAGKEADFQPRPPLLLAAFPLVRGARVESRGVDPTTAAAMTCTSTVTGKARVDACGEPLDSWTIDLTDGRYISRQPDGRSQDLEFSATYAVGTQFGGLVLRETSAFAGTQNGAGVSRTNTATINQVPRAAPGPQP